MATQPIHLTGVSGPRPGAARVLAGIGNTPLLRVPELEPRPGVLVYAKLEGRNPGGSVKDRAALGILREGMARGDLAPGRTILDASSGNTAIAYAMIGAALGYPVEIVLPGNVSRIRQTILAAYGARVRLTDGQEGMDGAIAEARRLAEAHPERYFYGDQYNALANWRAHYDGTGPEILHQTGWRVTHFVAGLGTTGTFTGVGRRLRDEVPGVRLVAMQPDSPLHALEGIKHLESVKHVPGIYDSRLVDGTEVVSTEEAQAMARRLARAEGILLGPSGAAAAVATERTAQGARSGVVVTVFPDTAEKYLDDPFWKEAP